MTDASQKERSIILSPFADALHGKRIGVAQEKISDALVGYSVLYRRLQRALYTALNSLEEYEESREMEHWGESKTDSYDHLTDFLSAIYVAAELFEFYESEIIKIVNPSGKIRAEFRQEMRDLKRFSVIICNKCKHNHAYLDKVEIIYRNGMHVTGFSVYKTEKSVSVPIKEIHRDSPAFSLNWGFRNIITDVLLADMAAAKLVNSLPDKSLESLLTSTYTLPIFEEVRRIAALPVVSMPQEVCRVSFNVGPNQSVHLDLYEKSNPHGKGIMFASMNLIAPSTAIRFPYVEGETTFSLASEPDPNIPVTGYFRVVGADIEVEDK